MSADGRIATEEIAAEEPFPGSDGDAVARDDEGADATALGRDLREQALRALRELLRGFEEADRRRGGSILRDYAGKHRQEIYAGLVTAILRVVVILHAEERGLVQVDPDSSLPSVARPIAELFDELVEDQRRLGDDAMSERLGAWSRLVALFRRIHEGSAATAGGRSRERRRGGLFDPDAYPFLEGRRRGSGRRAGEAIDSPPPVSDGAILRVLSLLIVRRSARLRYEELGVEHIGTVHEGLMGFALEVAEGDSIALLPDHVVLDLSALLRLQGAERRERLASVTDLDRGQRLLADVLAAQSVSDLERALARRASPDVPGLIPRGTLYLQPGEARRRAGSYYTPRELTREVVERALAPLLLPDGRDPSPGEILSLAVCDPAMGTGAFLVEACRQLASSLEAAFDRSGEAPPLAPGEDAHSRARRLIAEHCLYGVDRNPLAVDLARLSLWITAGSVALPMTFMGGRLACGDSLIGARIEDLDVYPAEAWLREEADPEKRALLRALYRKCRAEMRRFGEPAGRERLASAGVGALRRALDAWTAIWFWPMGGGGEGAPEPATPATLMAFLTAAASNDAKDRRAAIARRIARERRFFHFEAELPGVFGRASPGFDAIVGNPPWVAYAGRAAQPIDPAVFNVHLRRNPAFHGYRSLHGLFVRRCASLLRAGGRLGLVLPTSVSDLSGYEPTRRAHDALCAADPDLPDFGSDAFEGVFQPAMGLLSTRRGAGAEITGGEAAAWPLARSDLDPVAQGLLERLCALSALPAALFGERGFQTNVEDVVHIRRLDGPEPHAIYPIREGADIGEFIARPPRHSIDVSALKGRFRPESEWKAVRILIRQTARYPIAALGDGLPFRNSILAGFSGEGWSELALLAYVNSTPIRWFHYMRNRDARQGMPQVKIAHLRALPSPAPARAHLIAHLDALGERALRANAGISDADRAVLEGIVAEALDMTGDERARVAAWAAANPIPKSGG